MFAQKSIATAILLVGLVAVVGGAYLGKTENVISDSESDCVPDGDNRIPMRGTSCVQFDDIFQVCREGRMNRRGCSAKKMNTAFRMILFGGVGAVILGGFWLGMIKSIEWRKSKKISVNNMYEEGI